MGKIKLFSIAFLALLCITSCEELKPNFIAGRATGNTGDLTVAMTKAMWETKIGQRVRDDFGAIEPGLGYLMSENKFNIEQVEPKDLNTLFKTNRNVLLVRLSNKVVGDSAVVEIMKDKWAKQQRYVTVSANNAAALNRYFKKHGKELVEQFEQWERERILQSISLHDAPKTEEAIKKMFGISMTIDKGFKVRSSENGFMMIERNSRFKRMEFDTGGQEKLNILEGIMIWQRDYTDKIQFDNRYILAERDTMLRRYVKFPNNPDAYWGTEYDTVFYPVHDYIKIDNQYTVETKGRFKSFNATMGGPFVQVSILNPTTNKVVSASGWVHAPNVDKIELMRSLEAMLYSIKIDKPASPPNS